MQDKHVFNRIRKFGRLGRNKNKLMRRLIRKEKQHSKINERVIGRIIMAVKQIWKQKNHKKVKI